MSNPGVSAIYFTVDGADPRSVSTVASPLGPITGTAVARTAIVDSIASGNSWKYFVSATAPAANWKDSSFSDASWSAGNSRLGFGAGGGTNATSITAVDTDPVTAGTQKNLTYYFRRTISIPNPALLTGATLEIQRDDGCVVYLNGTEISRQNMPAGTITHTTPASSDTSAADAQVWFPIPISPASLATGNNLFAAEVHILANNSVRMGFNLRLRTQQPSANVPAGLAAGTHVVRARSIDVNGNWSAMSEQTYVVGSSTPYQTWKTTNGISNGSLDADLDGISNVLEYATGSNPNVRTTKPPVITTNKQNFTLTPPAVSGTYLTLQFVRSLTATDVTWTVETSSTLTGAWSPTPATLVTDVNNGDGTATSTYRLNTPFPGYGIRAFFRARATVP